MLKTINLIEKLGKEYESMLKQINIPDFYKCIAQYSGIKFKDLKDEVIENYLILWARNKKYIFDFFGGKTKVDMYIKYEDESKDYYSLYNELAKNFPAYYFWIRGFKNCHKNRMDRQSIDYDCELAIEKCFSGYKYTNESITHFFKNKLKAPDDLVTEIGRIYENDEVEANFTMSIDPVDIMLSSENPYDWESCYRLEHFDESHADGCLAGVIDTATIVTYIWNKEGKFNLYDLYEFKSIRYKRMRMTIAINKDFNAIHFNSIYPGKGNLSKGFQKLLRDKVETFFAEQLGKKNVWKKNDNKICCYRENSEYGYSEYSNLEVYLLSVEGESYNDIVPYNEKILCPCGCGEEFIGTYENDDDNYYNGEGLINENFSIDDRCWCDILDEYVDCDGECHCCEVYNRRNAFCEISSGSCHIYDSGELENKGMLNPCDSDIIQCDERYCKNCPYYEEYKEVESN